MFHWKPEYLALQPIWEIKCQVNPYKICDSCWQRLPFIMRDLPEWVFNASADVFGLKLHLSDILIWCSVYFTSTVFMPTSCRHFSHQWHERVIPVQRNPDSPAVVEPCYPLHPHHTSRRSFTCDVSPSFFKHFCWWWCGVPFSFILWLLDITCKTKAKTHLSLKVHHIWPSSVGDIYCKS